MKYIILSLLLILGLQGFANDSTLLYDPKANVKKDMAAVIRRAKMENKHVLIQVGGNWCIWCLRFDGFLKSNKDLLELTEKNYVVYHLNHSPENNNLDYLKKLGFPQRFGFPVLVVLDANGKRLHTQDTGLLEKADSYNAAHIREFLINWAPPAFRESNYKE
jgi:thioredoxin-related protein